jgi:hypothetical protein
MDIKMKNIERQIKQKRNHHIICYSFQDINIFLVENLYNNLEEYVSAIPDEVDRLVCGNRKDNFF